MTDSQKASLQKLRELGYDSIADEIIKQLQKWDDWYIGNRASLVEHYLNARVWLHVNILVRINGQSSPSHDYAVQLQFLGLDKNIAEPGEISLPILNNTNTLDSIFHGCWGNSSKCAVLIDPVQIVDLPEWMRNIIVPSVVRLHRFDGSLGSGRNTADLSLLVFRVLGGVRKNGELRPPDLIFRHRDGVFLSKSHSQMIEAGSQVEQEVTHRELETVGNLGSSVNTESSGFISVAERLRRGFGVWLIDDAVGFSLNPSVGLSLQGIEVFASVAEL